MIPSLLFSLFCKNKISAQLLLYAGGGEDWLAILKGGVKVSDDPVGMHLAHFMRKIIFNYLTISTLSTPSQLTRDQVPGLKV